MSGFIDEADRNQGILLPERVEEYVSEDNPVRVIDAFIGELDLAKLGFERMEPKSTGRPGYHPATMLKIYLYGYLNRIQSSRRLEQETRRNLELMWLVGRLAPDFKTLADFRAENAAAIKNVCREFIVLCRHWGLLTEATVAIDGSKFKAVNHRDQKTHLRTELILAALNMALTQRRPSEVIHHSDHGCQYTSYAFGKRCREAGVMPSMGSVGDAYGRVEMWRGDFRPIATVAAPFGQRCLN
jgi:transposase